MKIAFDCMGTLNGSKEKYVLMLLLELQKRGHSITVWSNGPSYPEAAVKRHGIKNADTGYKYGKGDYDRESFDFAVEDDTGQTWLAAKNFIWVHDIPETTAGIMALVQIMENK
jgi:hypothetical protein